MNHICLICGRTFHTWPGRVKKGQGKYCSPECKSKAQISPANCRCRVCGKKYRARPSRLHRGEGQYCSLKCHGIAAQGNGSPLWKGGRKYSTDGYVQIFSPLHPAAKTRPYVFEHRIVMEEKLGRFLKQIERVHHIDGNKKNNAPENLMLFPNETEHKKFHHKQGDYDLVYQKRREARNG